MLIHAGNAGNTGNTGHAAHHRTVGRRTCVLRDWPDVWQCVYDSYYHGAAATAAAAAAAAATTTIDDSGGDTRAKHPHLQLRKGQMSKLRPEQQR